jgi:hypothetical protein
MVGYCKVKLMPSGVLYSAIVGWKAMQVILTPESLIFAHRCGTHHLDQVGVEGNFCSGMAQSSNRSQE